MNNQYMEIIKNILIIKNNLYNNMKQKRNILKCDIFIIFIILLPFIIVINFILYNHLYNFIIHYHINIPNYLIMVKYFFF